MNELDRKILKTLQNLGRITNAELARIVGVAPSTMLERVRRLEENGTIKGYRALLDPDSIGLSVQAFVTVSLNQHEETDIKRFEEGVLEIANVKTCHHITGRFDYILHVAAKDLKHLGELIKNRIASIPGIGKVETFVALSEVKGEGGWPVETEMDDRANLMKGEST